ncbi:DUF2997 domain-containing protein [Roseiconus lacunae]|uniref:DUF2997 domain-containing protein n=1 Tax=Roseiconus lacunae TaxID=2605694 RepID=A0ABT7PF58_9BACT|nr:DUF2997 domain-containing protein [Roseiconus lacunae]MDM4015135.1 DUF2997 domain-containing protein [Roseiconus lacunae]
MKKIEILIRPDGENRVETKGFSGSECREASRLLETALGKRQSESLTSEYHTVVQNHHQTRQEE